MSKWSVGDTVVRTDINARIRPEVHGTIEKVGRTLVHVRFGPYDVETFRADTGRRNDGFGHGRISTPEEIAERRERERLTNALSAAGVKVWQASLSNDKLQRILAIVQDETA